MKKFTNGKDTLVEQPFTEGVEEDISTDLHPKDMSFHSTNERMKKKLAFNPAPVIAVCCSKCSRVTEYPLGSINPKEGACQHRFRKNIGRGTQGVLECINCTIDIPIASLLDINIEPEARYTREGVKFADEMQKLRDENLQLLAENARIRRQAERKK